MKIVYIVFFIFSIISCASIRDNNTNSGTSSVRVINETSFDVSVLEEDNFIPRKTEKTIELPIQNYELSEGYPLTFYINITNEVKIPIPHGSLHVRCNSQVVYITDDYTNFNSNDCFFVIDNESNFAITVKNGDSHILEWKPDVEDKEKRTQILPKETFIYKADDSTSYSIENQNFKSDLIPIPLDHKEDYVYYFVFDGSSIALVSSQPLIKFATNRAKELEVQEEERQRQFFQDQEEKERQQQFWSLGISVGTSSFIQDPLLIGTVQGTISPWRNLFFRIGLDVGLLSNEPDLKSWSSYYSLFPFANINFFWPFHEKISWYTGVGGGLMYAEYGYTGEKNSYPLFDNVFMDVITGVTFFDAIDVSYTLRTNFNGFIHKLSLGYVYRFRKGGI